jgi:hypothetical protein
VAKRWGLVPRQWREQSVDDQAAMMAFEMFCDTREAYRDEFKKKSKGGGTTGHDGENEYEKLKRLMKI